MTAQEIPRVTASEDHAAVVAEGDRAAERAGEEGEREDGQQGRDARKALHGQRILAGTPLVGPLASSGPGPGTTGGALASSRVGRNRPASLAYGRSKTNSRFKPSWKRRSAIVRKPARSNTLLVVEASKP